MKNWIEVLNIVKLMIEEIRNWDEDRKWKQGPERNETKL